MANLLNVEHRKQFGKRNNRRMRSDGKTPAILYGHGEEPVSLTLTADQLESIVRHGAKVVELAGAESGKALLKTCSGTRSSIMCCTSICCAYTPAKR